MNYTQNLKKLHNKFQIQKKWKTLSVLYKNPLWYIKKTQKKLRY